MKYSEQLETTLNNLRKLTGLNLDVSVSSEEDEVFALHQLQNLYKTYKEKYDFTYFLQSLLLNEWTLSNVSGWAKKTRVSAEQRRVVYLVKGSQPFGEQVPEILRSTVPDSARTFIIPMSDEEIAVIHTLNDGENEEDIQKYAYVIIDSILAEAMIRVKAAYSEPVDHLQKLHGAWKNVRLAMNVGQAFYASEDVYAYSRLGIGGLLYQLPSAACKKFLAEIFHDSLSILHEPDTRRLIECFFFNNLNVSLTAKQLNLHRTTFLNRIERIERETGLCLRDVEDVTTFRLSLMLIDYLNCQKGV